MQHEPVLVTTAGQSAVEDRRNRTRRYLISQGIRVACVLLAVLLPVAPIWKLGFIVASIALPWFGVIAANAGPTLDRRRPVAVDPTPLTALPPPHVQALQAHRIIDAER